MPEVNVKALAELIHLPVYGYARILAEQKYPGQVPAVFRVPFYGPALQGIRRYYRSGNDLAVIDRPIQEVRASGATPPKLAHNVAVLQAFRQGRQRRRDLTLTAVTTYEIELAGVHVRFRPDVQVLEGDRTKYLIYGFRMWSPPSRLLVRQSNLHITCWPRTVSSANREMLSSFHYDPATLCGRIVCALPLLRAPATAHARSFTYGPMCNPPA